MHGTEVHGIFAQEINCAAAAAAAAAAAGLLLLSNLLAQSGDVTCNSGIHERSSSMKKIPTTLPFTVFFI
jgi:hypothetical protein